MRDARWVGATSEQNEMIRGELCVPVPSLLNGIVFVEASVTNNNFGVYQGAVDGELIVRLFASAFQTITFF